MKKIWLTLLILWMFFTNIYSQTIFVTNDEQLKSAVNSAQPGDTIVVRNGSFDTDGSVTIRNNGTVDKPIVIKAETVGGTELINESYFDFRKCSYITLNGFIFSSTDVTAIKLQASHHIRITNNVFRIKETESVKWVLIGGIWDDPNAISYENKIDHNIFENKTMPGNFITIDGTGDPTYLVSQRDTIEYNYFKNNNPRAENEKESIRIGWSEMSLSSGFTVVQHNLFEDCNGDPEIISVKTCDNIIRNNTFRRCKGTLSLRHGDRNTVNGNYFFGENIEGTGGVRIYGKDHKIFNNYFEGLTGTKWDAPITLTNGDYDGTSATSKHARIDNATIVFNTLVNNSHGIEIGFTNNNRYSKPPRNVTIANNIIVGSENELVKIISLPVSFIWQSNIFYPDGSAQAGIDLGDKEIKLANPMLAQSERVFRLSDQSIAIDSATGEWDFILDDIDGQLREAPFDIGADEYSNGAMNNKVLDSTDVGPINPNITSVTEENYSNDLKAIELYGIYPNPFNSSARIQFLLNEGNNLKIYVFDTLGNMVNELVSAYFPEGFHSLVWNTSKNYKSISSGIYFVVIKSPKHILTQKIVYVK